MAKYPDPNGLVEEDVNPDDLVEGGPLPPLTRTGLSSMAEPVEKALTTPTGINMPTGIPGVSLPTSDMSLSQIATTPQRGMRGLGVGIQSLIEGQESSIALERAVEAVKPGFEPKEGERLGSFVGETIGAMPLATALTGGAAAAPQALFGKQAIFSALKGAGGGASISAIEQASERGDIDLQDVGIVASTGFLMPLIVPTTKALTKLVRVIVRGQPQIGTTLSAEAAGELMQNPKLLNQYAGTMKSVRDRVIGLQNGLKRHLERVSDRLVEARTNFGLIEPVEDAASAWQRIDFNPRTAGEIGEDLMDLQRGYKFTEKVSQGIKLGGKEGLELIPETKKEFVKQTINPKERIRDLYNLRSDIDNFINYSTQRKDVPPVSGKVQAQIKDARFRVNELIDSLIDAPDAPAGSKMLRATDAAYAQAKDIYGNLQKDLATKGKSEQVLLRILKGDDPDEIAGLTADAVEGIRRLEKATGKKYLDDLRKDWLASNIRKVKAKPIQEAGVFNLLSTGPGVEVMGPENLSRGFYAVRGITSVLDKIIEATAKSGIPADIASKLSR